MSVTAPPAPVNARAGSSGPSAAPPAATTGPPPVDAARLLARGLALCKPDPNTKSPTYLSWPTRSLEAKDFGAGDLYGIIAGPLSDGNRPGHALVTVDLDHRLAVEKADDFLPPTRMEEGRPGKPRDHRSYLVPFDTIPEGAWSQAAQAATAAKAVKGHPGPLKKGFNHAETNERLIDFVGTGGQVVCPSPGNQRQWVGGEPGEPAVVPFPALWDATCRLAEACGAEACGAAAGPQARAARPEAPAAPPIKLDTRTPDAVMRAAAYVRKYPPGTEGQDASGNAFTLACKLVRGFMLDAETALRLMLHSDWNAGCRGKDGRAWPWSEKELRHKIEGARSAPEKEAEGYLLHAPRKGSGPAQPGAWRPRLAAAAPACEDPPVEKGSTESTGGKESPAPAKAPDAPGLVTTCLSAIRIEPVRWLVPAYFPSGKLILVAGDGGNGKSAFTLDTTACLTTGRPCLGQKYDAPPAADVLLIACEDGYEDTVVPRLLAAGADLRRCHRLDGLRAKDGKLDPFSLAHYEELRRHLQTNKDIRFVVIDPAGSYIGRAGVDENKDAELRSLLDPLAQLASECGATILLVKHLNKGATAKAVHKVGGSMGYTNAVRAAYILAPDPDDCTLKLLMPIKFNCGHWPPALSFRIKELVGPEGAAVLREHAAHLAAEDQQLLADQLHRITWLGEVERDADQVLGAANQQGKNKVEACAAWLREFLREYAYPSDEIKDASEKAGFTFDNLKEAKALLKNKVGLRSTNRNTFQGKWWCGLGEPAVWQLRPEPSTAAPHTPYSPLSPQSPHSPHTGMDHGRVGSVGRVGSGGREAEDSLPDEYGDAWEGP